MFTKTKKCQHRMSGFWCPMLLGATAAITIACLWHKTLGCMMEAGKSCLSECKRAGSAMMQMMSEPCRGQNG